MAGIFKQRSAWTSPSPSELLELHSYESKESISWISCYNTRGIKSTRQKYLFLQHLSDTYPHTDFHKITPSTVQGHIWRGSPGLNFADVTRKSLEVNEQMIQHLVPDWLTLQVFKDFSIIVMWLNQNAEHFIFTNNEILFLEKVLLGHYLVQKMLSYVFYAHQEVCIQNTWKAHESFQKWVISWRH